MGEVGGKVYRFYKKYCLVYPEKAHKKAWKDGNLFIKDTIELVSRKIYNGKSAMFDYGDSFFYEIAEIIPRKIVLLYGFSGGGWDGLKFLVAVVAEPIPSGRYKLYKLEIDAVAIKEIKVRTDSEVKIEWKGATIEEWDWERGLKRKKGKIPIPQKEDFKHKEGR